MEKNDIAFGVLGYMALDAYKRLAAGCGTLDVMKVIEGAEILTGVEEEAAEFRRITADMGALLKRMDKRAPEHMARARRGHADEHA